MSCILAPQRCHLDHPVVQAFGVLVPLQSDGEGQLVVSEGAEGLDCDRVAILNEDFGLVEVARNLTGGKINVCEEDNLIIWETFQIPLWTPHLHIHTEGEKEGEGERRSKLIQQKIRLGNH